MLCKSTLPSGATKWWYGDNSARAVYKSRYLPFARAFIVSSPNGYITNSTPSNSIDPNYGKSYPSPDPKYLL